jgi:hypothetical protein
VHLVPGALAQSLTFGVTTVLDMFSKPDLVARAASARRKPWPLPQPNRRGRSASPTEDVSRPGSVRTWSSCPVTR